MIKTLKNGVFGLACLLSGSAFAVPAPVDLSTWLIDGNGNWILESTVESNDSALQTLNSIPTVLFNNVNSQGTALSGSITSLSTGGDNDFMGFVLGYDNDDLFGTNATTDYILIDWKQGAQSGWDAGMAISRVTGGPIATNGVCTSCDAWQHTGNVALIERAATLGYTGWVDNQTYSFDIIFTASNIQVFVDSVLQFDINGTFEDGSFGFYNFSEPYVRYAGITEVDFCAENPNDPACTGGNVPAPAPLALMGLGFAALGFCRKRKTV